MLDRWIILKRNIVSSNKIANLTRNVAFFLFKCDFLKSLVFADCGIYFLDHFLNFEATAFILCMLLQQISLQTAGYIDFCYPLYFLCENGFLPLTPLFFRGISAVNFHPLIIHTNYDPSDTKTSQLFVGIFVWLFAPNRMNVLRII